MFQGIVIHFGSASTIIKNTIEVLQSLRMEKSWNEVKDHILELCSELGVEKKRRESSIESDFLTKIILTSLPSAMI